MLHGTTKAKRYRHRVPVRPDVPGDTRAYICPKCDVLLADEVAYEQCPVCDLAVDWVDTGHQVWACPGCDGLVNATITPRPECKACKRKFVLVHDPASGSPYPTSSWNFASARRLLLNKWVLTAAYFVALLPALAMAWDSRVKAAFLAVAGPFVLLPALFGLSLLGVVGASFRELHTLLLTKRTRVIHGLEHATLKILEGQGVPVLSGQTWAGSFEAFFDADELWTHKERSIRDAFREAVGRVTGGDRSLLYDPRCGTSYLVAALLLAFLAVLAGAVGLFFSLGLNQLIIIFGLFSVLVLFGTRPLGLLAQRLVTVSANFDSAKVLRIVRRKPVRGMLRYEVVVAIDEDHSHPRESGDPGNRS